MTTGPHNSTPSPDYNRLIKAFGLEQDPEQPRRYFMVLSGLLDVKMSALSDCIRRGYVTDKVLAAGKNKGIIPDYITGVVMPIRLGATDQK